MPSPSTPITSSYWCYSCTRFVSVWTESEQNTTTVTISCPHCDGGFIEEITDPSSSTAATELTPPPSTEVRSIINNRRSIIRRRRSNRHPSFNPVIVLQGGAGGERDDGEEDRRRRRAFEFYYDDGSGLGLRPLPDSVSEILMGSGFERLLEQLSQIDSAGMGLGRSGNPPASKSAIESLARVEIRGCHVDAEEVSCCAVCTEVFERETEAREMPCKHVFHEDCIVPWLSIRNSCPVCRFELPSSESSNGEEGGGNSPVGMTIWRLPGGGFAVGRFNAAMREGERVLPVVLTEMDGGGIGGGNRSDGPRRISWVRANGALDSGSDGSGSGGRLRRMVRGVVSLMRRVRRPPNRAVSSSTSNHLDLDGEVETRVMNRSNSVLRRYFGRNRSNRDSSVLH